MEIDRLKELSRQIEESEQVLETLESKGWKNTIEPILDKMIIDVLGHKQNGRWHNGSLDAKGLGEEKAQVLISYKRALTDLHSYIYGVVDSLKPNRAEYAELLKDEKEQPTNETETDYNLEEDGKD